MIHQFVPKDLKRLYLIEWFIIWPTEIFLVAALHLDSAMEELQFKLFPSVYHLFTSGTLSKGLKHNTKMYIGSSIGVSKYCDIQSNFMEHHQDPKPVGKGNDTANRQQGHTPGNANSWYNRTLAIPHGFTVTGLRCFQRNSRWWQHLTGKSFPGQLIESHLTLSPRHP